MKWFSFYPLLVFTSCFVLSCQKHKTLEGNYIIYFNGVASSSLGDTAVQHSRSLVVKDSKKHYIHFGNGENNNFILSKNENEVFGTHPAVGINTGNGFGYFYGPYYLQGTWRIKYGKYRIEGTYEGVYTYTTSSPNSTQTVYQETGVFEIIGH